MAEDYCDNVIPPPNQFHGIEIREFSGKRDNTKRYYRAGFFYHSDSRNPYIFRCSRRSTILCPGLIKLDEDGAIQEMI